MKSKPAFIDDGAAIYEAPSLTPVPLVDLGVVNGRAWLLSPDDNFRFLRDANLTEKVDAGGITFTAPDGTVAYSIVPLRLCEELSEGDVMQTILEERRRFDEGPASAWLDEQIEALSEADAAQFEWVPLP